MTREDHKSCICTINTLRRLALNIHGVIDVVDDANCDKLIELLKQEPCDDAISRAELKKWLDMNFSFGGATRKLELFERLDKELPPVTTVQGWIPISERLPKAGEYVGNVAKYYLVQNEYGDMMVAHYNGKYWEQVFKLGPITDEIIAWRELPEPYKAESEGKK